MKVSIFVLTVILLTNVFAIANPLFIEGQEETIKGIVVKKMLRGAKVLLKEKTSGFVIEREFQLVLFTKDENIIKNISELEDQQELKGMWNKDTSMWLYSRHGFGIRELKVHPFNVREFNSPSIGNNTTRQGKVNIGDNHETESDGCCIS